MIIGDGVLFPDALIIVRMRLLRLWPEAVVLDDRPMLGPWRLEESVTLWALPCSIFVYRDAEAAVCTDNPVELIQVFATSTGITLVVEEDVYEKVAHEIIQALRDNLLLV
jgi:hypothetical protein